MNGYKVIVTMNAVPVGTGMQIRQIMSNERESGPSGQLTLLLARNSCEKALPLKIGLMCSQASHRADAASVADGATGLY